MIRLGGHNLPDHHRIEFALTSVYGIGWKRARDILASVKLSTDTKVADLSDEQVQMLQAALSTFKIEGDLREEVSDNVKRMREIGAYRGTRHARGLPAHGQRTRSNGRTRRGKKKTVGSFTKEDLARQQQNKK